MAFFILYVSKILLDTHNHLAKCVFPLPGKPRNIVRNFFSSHENLAVVKGIKYDNFKFKKKKLMPMQQKTRKELLYSLL